MDGVPVGRLFGIVIRIHWSWVIILALVAAIGSAEATETAPDLAPIVHWLVGGVVEPRPEERPGSGECHSGAVLRRGVAGDELLPLAPGGSVAREQVGRVDQARADEGVTRDLQEPCGRAAGLSSGVRSG